jgi:hypothetical protein
VRRLAIAAIMIVLLPASAFAEEEHGPATARTDSEKKSDAAIDKAYQDAVKRMDGSGKPVKVDDPWQTIRPAPSDGAKR